MADIKISELTQAESLSTSDLLETAIPNNGGFLSRRMSLAQLSNYLENYVQHQALTTTAKTIVSAINEVLGDLANYYTTSQTYSKTEVDTLIAGVSGLHFLVVQQLPTTDIDVNTIYLVPKQDVGTQDIYDEYIYIVEEAPTPSHWEKIGTTQIDLSDYVTDTELTTILNDYVTSSGLNTILANYATTSAMTTALADKVDKVSGKGLSTEDYTTTEKAKLNGIDDGAEVNPTVATGSVFGSLSFDGTNKIVKLSADSQGSGLDLNNFKTSGLYYFNQSNTPTNIPAGDNGILMVLESVSIVKQIWMRQGTKDSNDFQSFVRTYYFSSNNWSAWHPIISGETVSSVEPTTTASKAYAVGDYLMRNGYLYRVTLAISSGDTIVTSGSGANVIRAYIGNEILSVKNNIPTALSQLSDDATHRLVTDTEKSQWNSAVLTKNLSDEDLNTLKATGFYVGASGNTCVNKPSGVNQFALIVIKTASSGENYCKQILIAPNPAGDTYYRTLTNYPVQNAWSNWVMNPDVSWDEYSNYGIKNLITYPYTASLIAGSKYTHRGVTFTDNGYGIVNVDGDNNGNGNSTCSLITDSVDGCLRLQAGTYIVTGGVNADCFLRINRGTIGSTTRSTLVTDYGEGATFTVSQSDSETYYYFPVIYVPTNKSADNVTVRPMIRHISVTNSYWKRFAKTNLDLTLEKADYRQIADVELTDNASRAYAVNEFMIWRGSLCRVKLAISSGGSISTSNVESTTLSAQLKQIRDALNI